MGRDVLSIRQVMVLLLVALLAPATDLLPSMAARQAGRGGWLIALGALPVLLVAVWACSKVFCGRGLSAEVGKPLGHTIIMMYLIWILFVLSLVFRLSVARMETVYNKVPPILFAVGVAALAVWMGMGKASALARAAEIFYLALAVILAGVLLLALFKVEWGNLYPVEWSKLPGGSLSAAGILLNVVPVAILGTRVPKKVRSARSVCGWVIAFCVAVTLVLVAVIGSTGSGLSARLNIPYLIMVQGLGVKGAFQRTEALIAAMWLLSDLILAGVLLRAGNEYVTELKSEQWGRWSVPVAAVIAITAGWLLLPQEDRVWEYCTGVLPVTGILLGLVIPAFLLLISVVRKQKKR